MLLYSNPQLLLYQELGSRGGWDGRTTTWAIHGMDRSDPGTRTGIWDPLCSPHHRSSGGCLVPNRIVVTQTCASFNDTWSSFEIVFELESNALIAISVDLRSEFARSTYTSIAVVDKGRIGWEDWRCTSQHIEIRNYHMFITLDNCSAFKWEFHASNFLLLVHKRTR